MNKISFLTLFLLIRISAYSQNISISKIDDFTKKEILQINASKNKKWKGSDNIAKGFFNNIFLSLRKTGTLNTIQLDIQIGAIICLNNLDGKTIILFNDDTTTELTQVSRLECAQRILSSYYLPAESLKKLAQVEIKKMRIYTTDGYFDFEIKEDKKELIKNTFILLDNK